MLRRFQSLRRLAVLSSTPVPLSSGHPHSLSRPFSSAITLLSKKGAKQENDSVDPIHLLENNEIGMGQMRNFSIVAHVDHGKSTLADRLLEITGTIPQDRVKRDQLLDSLKVERERGITVKAQTASMIYRKDDTPYLLNLIDTPGHVDFSYEVSRSLSACEGVLLLVDAAQGVQAQTVANYTLAVDNNLEIIPVINKIDQMNADVERVAFQMNTAFGIDEDSVLLASAKTGLGVRELLPAIVDRIPAPIADEQDVPFKGLLFDSWFDSYRGVITLVKVAAGTVAKGDKIQCFHSGKSYDVLELGLLAPERKQTNKLVTGQVGYVITGMKTTAEARVGDTFFRAPPASSELVVRPLPGFRPAKPMVFAGIYPSESDEFDKLRLAIEKLCLNDSSVTVTTESSATLGMGFRCGFLGLLHMDVWRQRLEDEHDADVVVTNPTVPYKAVMRKAKGESESQVIDIETAVDFPDRTAVDCYLEPVVNATIITPEEYMGPLLNLCEDRRGKQLEINLLDEKRSIIKYRLPLNEIVGDFFDELKSRSSGYASLDYDPPEYEKSSLSKLNILLNGSVVDAFSQIVHVDKAYRVGRDIATRLKEVLKRQQFEIAIQAAVGGKIIARETIKAYRKNVLDKSGKTVGGGDFSRKQKLLKKQKEGKKRARMIGRVEVSQEAFLAASGGARLKDNA
eukprot:CAMPEP_0113918320 /NCGR_PEP_ID=MMETSP0780_2-20120614/33283_1 /TAXON_ID=652834 /ORGANISM="Palpitomonas bilix" /LENGTH=681 /DNA_ID=CAMNT_0000918109 /DNA_START=1 /DNA_END=2046 /DNA_ORIENTATION=+ /assembly_acc=CAM_ASM_000599